MEAMLKYIPQNAEMFWYYSTSAATGIGNYFFMTDFHRNYISPHYYVGSSLLLDGKLDEQQSDDGNTF